MTTINGFEIKFNELWKRYYIVGHPECGAIELFKTVQDAAEFIKASGSENNNKGIK
jgi:hypothetical protein